MTKTRITLTENGYVVSGETNEIILTAAATLAKAMLAKKVLGNVRAKAPNNQTKLS